MEQLQFMYAEELIVDNFAGGGGASLGLELAFGRSPDIAINHDPEAVAMHKANHPNTKHYCEDVWKVDPVKAVDGRPVGFAWFSPDCKHFSKAKGGKPVSKKIRGLAWIVVKWAKKVRPRVIALENVEEFQDWGPLTFKRDNNGDYLIKDGNPVMVPCPERKGQTFQRWKAELERLGYRVEFRQRRACDSGAATTRKRLYMIARCDGLPVVWPEPMFGARDSIEVKKGKLEPWHTAAECIDWSIPVKSIFDRKKDLAANTLRRIARGMERFVINHPDPFIVRIGHTGWNGNGMQYDINDPLTTITSKAEHCLVVPFVAKHYGGNYTGSGIDARSPIDTITTRDHHAIVTSHLVHLRGTCKDGRDIRLPVPTITAGGQHIGEVRGFAVKYYGPNIGHALDEPLQTITSKHRFALSTAETITPPLTEEQRYAAWWCARFIEQYGTKKDDSMLFPSERPAFIQVDDGVLVDIGMRMLEPRELYRAQGFPNSYKINIVYNGKRLSKTAQVRMCGNSVSPKEAEALARANVGVKRTRKNLQEAA